MEKCRWTAEGPRASFTRQPFLEAYCVWLRFISWVSISHHAGQASISAASALVHLRPRGAHGVALHGPRGRTPWAPGAHAHLVPPEDRQRLSHGLPVGQDEVQHPVSIEVCHHTPCNKADFTLAIGQETQQGEGVPTTAQSCTCPTGGRGEAESTALGQEAGGGG